MDYLYLFAGLIGLLFAGEALVRGSVGIARHTAIPPLLTGLTVVGFGTSPPKLLAPIATARRGGPDILNLLGFLGVTALIVRSAGMPLAGYAPDAWAAQG